MESFLTVYRSCFFSSCLKIMGSDSDWELEDSVFSDEKNHGLSHLGTQDAFWTDSSYRAKNSPQELSPEHRERDDSDDDIPLIPDIDELQEDDYYNDIAAAPDIPPANLSFIQLNSDLKKYAAFSVVDSINLGLLSKHLFKESDLKENDNKWSWDLLFTEVSSELRSEWKASTDANAGETHS